MDGFVETLMTVRLPDGQGLLDVKLKSLPIPRDMEAILDLPLSRLAIKHGPRHWLMDRVAIDDVRAVLICRECQLRLEIPARAKDLFELVMFWHCRVGRTCYRLNFRHDDGAFTRYFTKRTRNPT